MKPVCVFATPSLDHRVTLDYLRSWTKTVSLLKDSGIDHGMISRGGDCFVAKVRNKLVKQFLDGPGTDLFFIDDDLGWPEQKVLEFILSPEPIIAGVYPKKSDDLDWPVGLECDLTRGKLIEESGLFIASFAGSGFMRIKREVLEALVKVVPTFKDIEMGGRTEEFPMVFSSGLDADGWFCGEDVSFCRLARVHGYPVAVDPNIEFKHRGGKTWKGTLADSIPHFRARASMAVAKEAA